MENASDAIKMAAAILIFLGAITIAIFAFSRARAASTSIMSNSGNKEYYDAENLNITSNRKVGIETVIPTLYSYYKENATILFYIGKGYNSENNTFTEIKPLTLYYTEAIDITSKNGTDKSPLQKSTLAVKEEGKNTRKIYGIDINDELTRQEPWSYNEKYDKYFIDDLINSYPTLTSTTQTDKSINQKYYTSKKNQSAKNFFGKDNNGGTYYQLSFQYANEIGGTLSTNTDARFVERIGQYNYNALYSSTTQDSQTTIQYNSTTTDQSTTTFDNGESMANENGNQKKVIQYIYISNK